ncbi:MAG: hypothetical protein ACJATV_001402 [Granulosicoccus sp.]|jgi:hypothetical protein
MMIVIAPYFGYTLGYFYAQFIMKISTGIANVGYD